MLDSWDWDERMYGAIALRKTYKDLPGEQPERTVIRPTSYVEGWLAHAAGESLIPATGRLAQHALEHTPHHPRPLGRRLVRRARGTVPRRAHRHPREPRPRQARLEDAERLALVRTAVRAIHTAPDLQDDLAQRAGITSPTLDAWLKENPDA
ncbi:hypothetical protein ACWFNE_12290 [Cellulomonas sp. NPDC055163]